MKYTSPIGRIVQGNPLVGNPQKDPKTGVPKLGKDGTQLINHYANVAFDKNNPKTGEMIAAIFSECARLYPALFPYGYQPQARNDVQPPIHAGGCIRSDFAYKIKDGDGYDANGKPHAEKEGWKGHWILQISTYAGPIRVVNGLSNNSPINEVGSGPNHIKTGDFVVCCLNIDTNGWTGDPQSKPGIYMNPDLMQLTGYGAFIAGGPDADTLLKDVAVATGGYVPVGMTTTPTAAALPGVPPLPAPLQPAGSAGVLPVIPPAQSLPAAPALPSITLPSQAAAPQYVISPEAAAAGFTKESLNAAGHTDEALVANGYLIPQAAAPAVQSLPSITPQAPALPVIPNHAVVQAVLATPTYAVTPAVAAQGHTLESLQAGGHTLDALLQAGYITRA